MKSKDAVKENPKLKGFAFHGTLFSSVVEEQAIGHCIFCDYRKDRFYVNTSNKRWDCKACGESGGYNKFLYLVSKLNAVKFKGKVSKELSQLKNLKVKTLRKHKIGWNGERYTVPIDDVNSEYLIDLKHYKKGGKVLGSPGGKVGLFGLDALKSNEAKVTTIWLCEGEWDTMVMSEILAEFNINNICLGTSASTFKAEWVPFFEGHDVNILYDKDPAGDKGTKRVITYLEGIARHIKFLQWPEDLPVGTDVSDLFMLNEKNYRKTLNAIKKMLTSDKVIKEEEAKAEAIIFTGEGLEREEIVEGYRAWMHLPDPEPLDVMYSTILANRLPGDPLWMFLVAPPGGSKSELLMSISSSREVIATTSLTPHALVSGAHGPGGKDPSLLPKLNNKILVIKDFTTILSMPYSSRDEILGVLRDAYDGKTRKDFGGGAFVRTYTSKFGVIAGVTPAIELFNKVHTTLGERFLRYRIKFKGDITVASDIIDRALRNITKENDMRKELSELCEETLNRNLPKDMPVLPKEYHNNIIGLAQWVSSLRAIVVREPYTGEMLYKPQAEIGTRLAKQLGKLALGLCLHYRIDRVGEDQYKTLCKVARDTAPDRVEELVRYMYTKTRIEEHLNIEDISEGTRFNPATTRALLQDLCVLNITQKEQGVRSSNWRINPTMFRLMDKLRIYEKKGRRRNGKEKKKARRKKIKTGVRERRRAYSLGKKPKKE